MFGTETRAITEADIPDDGIVYAVVRPENALAASRLGLFGSTAFFSMPLPLAFTSYDAAIEWASECDGAVLSVDTARCEGVDGWLAEVERPGQLQIYGMVPAAAVDILDGGPVASPIVKMGM